MRQPKKLKSHKINNILKYFGSALISLDATLIHLSGETGTRLTSDFPNGIASVIGSAMENQGEVVVGRQNISLGTNACWSFTVSTFDTRPYVKSLNPYQRSLERNPDAGYFFPLENGDCDQLLRFGLKIETREDNMPRLIILPVMNSTSGPLADQVCVLLFDKQGCKLYERPSILNYQTNVDAALRELLGYSAQKERPQ